MQIVFNSSWPRSGSTLLQTLLAQCPQNHCTPTSDVIELLVQMRNSYGNFEAFKAQGVLRVKHRIKTAMRGLLEGYYADEVAATKTVFEKSRGWLAYIELLEEILEQQVKIVCCVRDIREIVASFERLHRENQLTKADPLPSAYADCQTVAGRAEQLLAKDSVLGLMLNRFRDVFARKLDDRLIIVPYSQLVANPIGLVSKLSEAVGSTQFTCDPSAVEQLVKEDDSVYGMQLHAVRKTVSAAGSTRWQDYLPQQLGDHINEQYPYLQQLAGVQL